LSEKQKARKSDFEKLVMDSDKQEMVSQWIGRVRELLDLTYFLGYGKLKNVLILSVSVPLFLPCKYKIYNSIDDNPKYKEMKSFSELDGLPEYQNIDYHNLKQDQIKKELEAIWS
jgi:hypothetical protein